MKKRTASEIENDFRKIEKVVANNTSVTSLKEIQELTGLSYAEVRTSLDSHPRLASRITKELENRKKNGVVSKPKATEPKNVAKATQKVYVVDASISGIDTTIERLNSLLKAGHKIVLTSITIMELDSMQKFCDSDGRAAREILAMASKDSVGFICTNIDESYQTHDDCIIQYCAEKKETVVLMTADKVMSLKARSFGVEVEFMERNRATEAREWPKVVTFGGIVKIGGKFYAQNNDPENKTLVVYSQGVRYRNSRAQIIPGSNLYLLCQRDGFVTFAHYRIKQLSLKNNCDMLYNKRIYSASDIEDMPIAIYKELVRDFLKRGVV